jgi:predicted dehydrogenase
MVGYGFMGRAHSNAYRKVNQFFPVGIRPVLKAVSARTPGELRTFADNWGWESTESDWRRLVERKDIDAIDICSPNDTHLDIALRAAAHGKMVLCEKPLAMDAAQGKKMVAAVEKAGVANMVWFNYRRVPAITLARQLVDEGRIGKVFHYRATYLQDWTISPDVPLGGRALWRLDKAVAGSGVAGDLSTHNIDTAIWLNGSVASVCGMTETFVTERPVQGQPGKRRKVQIDDACTFLARFANGSNGTFEATRYARGRKNKNSFEINGEKGSIYFDLENMHQLQYFDHQDPPHVQGWRTILVTASEHPYMKRWWVPGCVIGYEHTFINALADFLTGIETGEPARPTLRDALETQRVCDAVLRSARSGRWVKVAAS